MVNIIIFDEISRTARYLQDYIDIFDDISIYIMILLILCNAIRRILIKVFFSIFIVI